jgi:hypothetical protein
MRLLCCTRYTSSGSQKGAFFAHFLETNVKRRKMPRGDIYSSSGEKDVARVAPIGETKTTVLEFLQMNIRLIRPQRTSISNNSSLVGPRYVVASSR